MGKRKLRVEGANAKLDMLWKCWGKNNKFFSAENVPFVKPEERVRFFPGGESK